MPEPELSNDAFRPALEEIVLESGSRLQKAEFELSVLKSAQELYTQQVAIAEIVVEIQRTNDEYVKAIYENALAKQGTMR